MTTPERVLLQALCWRASGKTKWM